MKQRNRKWCRGTWVVVLGILIGLGSSAYGIHQNRFYDSEPPPSKTFLYSAKKLGIPILRTIIRMGYGSLNGEKSLYRVDAQVVSQNLPGLMLRMNNRFTSVMEITPFSPLQYVKEIDQEGLFIKKKRYMQMITFDSHSPKAIVEEDKNGKRKEIVFPCLAFDPLALFARYHLKEDLPLSQEIQMSIFDGVKFRQMVFQANRAKVLSPLFGELEAICLESKTAFSSFGEKEGTLRIWYTANREKLPIILELDLPIGSVKFELEEIRETKEVVQTPSKE